MPVLSIEPVQIFDKDFRGDSRRICKNLLLRKCDFNTPLAPRHVCGSYLRRI
jgi:hypothetical protein